MPKIERKVYKDKSHNIFGVSYTPFVKQKVFKLHLWNHVFALNVF